MKELKVDLTRKPDVFSEKNIIINEKANFIFGRNGTGKTTLTELILDQFSNDYNVHIFKDFEGVLENERLNAIALGIENVEIQKEVDIIDSKILEIKESIEPQENSEKNLYEQKETAEDNFKKQSEKIESFYSDTAKKIKEIDKPQRIAKIIYDKKELKKEMGGAKFLSEEEIKKHQAVLNDEFKETIEETIEEKYFPEIELSELLNSTNKLLLKKITTKVNIKELENNADKQNFAKEGVSLHKTDNSGHDKNCAFCGNEISDERWSLLVGYFNNEVEKLENSITSKIEDLDNYIKEIEELEEIDEDCFYTEYTKEISEINLNLQIIKGEYIKFFNKLKEGLEKKRKNLFSSSNELNLTIPGSFQKVQKECNLIIEKNNTFSKNSKKNRLSSKEALRFHHIKQELETLNYSVEYDRLKNLGEARDEILSRFKEKENELRELENNRRESISKAKNEEVIANKINNSLASMGVKSFSLELHKGDPEEQDGQYKIKGHDGKIRDITQISKGEKNMIAFLYFIFSFSELGEKNKKTIVIFDDPMTSNDDTMQYLMMQEMQKLYNGGGCYKKDCFKKGCSTWDHLRVNHFILLTHNCHFYINASPNDKKKYKKHSFFHLLKKETSTTIQTIKNKEDDLMNSYNMLWIDLLFLYENNKPDLMLGVCRRICETYLKFNRIEPSVFFKDNMEAKKLFDVNQHSIDDLGANLNPYDCDYIKEKLCTLFKENNDSDHFTKYWEQREVDSGDE